MIRIFASWQDRVILSADDEHHLVNVLRVLPGEKIELLIAGKVFLGVVQKTKPLQIEKLDHIDASHELPIRITLIYPVVKGEKMDWVVQKATELGVDELIPCSSERSVVHWDQHDLEKKWVRFQRIIKEATLQSKRETLMKMNRYINLSDAFKLDFSSKWIASESHVQSSIPNSLKFNKGSTISLVVGPEGGLSTNELTLAQTNGYQPFSLGPSILRSETAVIAALSILRERGF
ncbi:MAG: hypothetical protein RLZZ388_83 [Bacillota bacterium]